MVVYPGDSRRSTGRQSSVPLLLRKSRRSFGIAVRDTRFRVGPTSLTYHGGRRLCLPGPSVRPWVAVVLEAEAPVETGGGRGRGAGEVAQHVPNAADRLLDRIAVTFWAIQRRTGRHGTRLRTSLFVNRSVMVDDDDCCVTFKTRISPRSTCDRYLVAAVSLVGSVQASASVYLCRHFHENSNAL